MKKQLIDIWNSIKGFFVDLKNNLPFLKSDYDDGSTDLERLLENEDFLNIEDDSDADFDSELGSDSKSKTRFVNFEKYKPSNWSHLKRESTKKKATKRSEKKQFIERKSGNNIHINVPNPLHTVIAVLISCGVLICVGLLLFNFQSDEIQGIRGDLREYSQDGLVVGTNMEEAVSIDIEACSARIEYLTKMLSSGTGDYSSDDVRWLSAELEEIQNESESIRSILDSSDLDDSYLNQYRDDVQSPLKELENLYGTVSISSANSVNNGISDGAANETGEFWSTGSSVSGQLSWVIPCVIVGLLLALLVVLIKTKKINLKKLNIKRIKKPNLKNVKHQSHRRTMSS